MRIDTAFNMNESVWLISDDKIKQSSINEITITYSRDGSQKISYKIDNSDKEYSEDSLFKNKNSLINSL